MTNLSSPPAVPVWWTRWTSLGDLESALPFMKKERLRCMCVKECHWFDARRSLGHPLTEVRRLDSILKGDALSSVMEKLEDEGV